MNMYLHCFFQENTRNSNCKLRIKKLSTELDNICITYSYMAVKPAKYERNKDYPFGKSFASTTLVDEYDIFYFVRFFFFFFF